MAIIKIMRLISLPDPGHICGRREKGEGNGMERDENATGKRILSRLSPATPCNVNKQNKKTCPLFCSGARFSKVPVTLRARNQKFKSKYKE